MEDGTAAYLLLGIENESDVMYAEPVKNGLYDFLQYSKQVQQTAARHRGAKDRKGHNDGEFLSGFYREDRLTPVVTLAILFRARRWDGPRTLHEMMSTQDPGILRFVANYELNLIEPAALSTEDLGKFRSNLRSVLGFIKYSTDSDELNAFLTNDSGLRKLDAEAARVIRNCTNTDITIDEKDEVIDLCKAVQDMTDKARNEGRLENLRENIKNVMDSLHMTTEDAMKVLKVSTEDQTALKEMIASGE